MAFVYKLPNSDLIMACGQAGQDGEFKTIGEKQTAVAKFSLACGTKPNSTETRWVECQAWQRNATYAASVQKGDTVFAIGRIESREYNGKTYHTLTCDFVNIMRQLSVPFTSSAPLASNSADAGFMDALADTDDGDLPF